MNVKPLPLYSFWSKNEDQSTRKFKLITKSNVKPLPLYSKWSKNEDKKTLENQKLLIKSTGIAMFWIFGYSAVYWRTPLFYAVFRSTSLHCKRLRYLNGARKQTLNTGRSSKLVDQLNTAIYLIKKNQIKIRLGVQWISSLSPLRGSTTACLTS